MTMGHKVYYFSMPGRSCETPEEAPIFVNSNDELFARSRALDVDVLHLH
jgi:hypothetical protein